MQVLEQWETGRRPSIFSALARLRALKMRSQSTESVASSGSHASDERESDGHNNVITSAITSINSNIMYNNSNDSNDVYSLPAIETAVNIVIDEDDDDRLSVAIAGITPAVSPLSHFDRDSPVLQLSTSGISPVPIACITPVAKLELLQEVSVENDEPLSPYAITAPVMVKKRGKGKGNNVDDEQKNDDGCAK